MRYFNRLAGVTVVFASLPVFSAQIKATCTFGDARPISIEADTAPPASRFWDEPEATTQIESRRLKLAYRILEDGHSWGVVAQASFLDWAVRSDPHYNGPAEKIWYDLKPEMLLGPDLKPGKRTISVGDWPKIECSTEVEGDTEDFRRFFFQDLDGANLQLSQSVELKKSGSYWAYLQEGKVVQVVNDRLPFCELNVDPEGFPDDPRATLEPTTFENVRTGAHQGTTVSWIRLDSPVVTMECHGPGGFISLGGFMETVRGIFDLVLAPPAQPVPIYDVTSCWKAEDPEMAKEIGVPAKICFLDAKIDLRKREKEIYRVVDGVLTKSPTPLFYGNPWIAVRTDAYDGTIVSQVGGAKVMAEGYQGTVQLLPHLTAQFQTDPEGSVTGFVGVSAYRSETEVPPGDVYHEHVEHREYRTTYVRVK